MLEVVVASWVNLCTMVIPPTTSSAISTITRMTIIILISCSELQCIQSICKSSGVRCEKNGSFVYPVNPDIVNGYCSLAGPTANCLYGRYIIVPLVSFKSICNSHSLLG